MNVCFVISKDHSALLIVGHGSTVNPVARLDAGLGRKEEAIREAKHAVDLMPIGRDSWVGPQLVGTLALVYAWAGERQLAIEQLEMVAKIPFGPSYGDLRFNPCWNSLRSDPRFEKMVASLKPNLTRRPSNSAR